MSFSTPYPKGAKRIAAQKRALLYALFYMLTPFGKKLKYYYVYNNMEAKTHAKQVITPIDKIRILRKENRRLIKELTTLKNELSDCRDSKIVLEKRVVMLENVVATLLRLHYGEDVRADFIRYEVCVKENCVKFAEYEEFLTALRILSLFIQ